MCRGQFLIKIAFATTIDKVQGQTLKRFGIYPPYFPPTPNMWHFDNVVAAFIEGYRLRIEND
jgi:hypothetical protein